MSYTLVDAPLDRNVIYGIFREGACAYVGLTSRSLRHRVKWHRQMARAECPKYPVHRALKKYGLEAFELRVLERDPVDLAAAEIKWVAELRPMYNLAAAGGRGCSGWKMSAEQRERIRQRMLGNQLGVGRYRPHNRRPTAESIAALVAGGVRAAKARVRAVSCSNGEVFASVSEAATRFGTHKSAISSVASGKRRAWYGLEFRYVDQ